MAKGTLYVAYLRNPELHSNAATSHVGSGRSVQEALADSLYWANQQPWVVVRPYAKAPAWAREQADQLNEPVSGVRCLICGAPSTRPVRRVEAENWHCGCRR